jgi:phospholipid/cholesterol/gamma-HCH transport system substrate-binding protein
MNHNIIETAMGAVVLAAAGIFLVFAMRTADVDTSVGYPVQAAFSNAQGLMVGSDVRIGGVKVGSVSKLELDQNTYMAVATLTIENGVQLPSDTAATIRSESLMGGKFLALEPGGAEEMLASGGRIEHTQSTPDLEQLLGQAIFSMSQSKSGEAASAPATAQP